MFVTICVQGFGHYMLEATPTVRERGVLIGYDARHNSSRSEVNIQLFQVI